MICGWQHDYILVLMHIFCTTLDRVSRCVCCSLAVQLYTSKESRQPWHLSEEGGSRPTPDFNSETLWYKTYFIWRQFLMVTEQCYTSDFRKNQAKCSLFAAHSLFLFTWAKWCFCISVIYRVILMRGWFSFFFFLG